MSQDTDDHRANGTEEPMVGADSTTQEASDLNETVARLRRENAQLRQRYESLRQTQYRRTIVALVVLGVSGLVGAAAFPPVRETLVVLGAIGLFGAVVTRYLSPEQFIPVGVGSAVFEPLAKNHDAVVDELGLQDTRVYVPDASRETVRLFVPESSEYSLPESDALQDTFVIAADDTERGVAFTPSGAGLAAEFERQLDGLFGDDPQTLARQSTDALVELFELVESATAEVDADDGRMTVRLTDCRFGSATTFDTPVASFIAVVVARGLGTPVTVETTHEEKNTFAVTCRWDSSVGADESDDVHEKSN
ncbi:hypothetical protein [Haloferax sp. DFSO52]|uniref:hypothetical protein n=1 Tax=Haloferax sp. DFSO52 TaxID=3388505 RepID=UPI003A83AC38